MSRIERYQESIEKFINNKNIIDENIRHLLKRDHLSGIILASILNNITKKTNFKIHGYYMALSLDILYIICEYQSYNNYYNSKVTNLNNLILQLITSIYSLFQLNIEGLKIPAKQENSYSKIISFILSYINSKLLIITKQYEFTKLKKMNKSDILTISQITTQLRTKLKSLNQIDKEELINYVTNTYGYIGMFVFIVSWCLGGGDLKPELMKELQSIGETYGILYKICIDFENIIEDINKSNKYSYNIVVNLGIQESFTLFMDLKTKFIEACLKNNIYSHTIKEVIDLLETKIDKCLKNASIDMTSTYSSFSK